MEIEEEVPKVRFTAKVGKSLRSWRLIVSDINVKNLQFMSTIDTAIYLKDTTTNKTYFANAEEAFPRVEWDFDHKYEVISQGAVHKISNTEEEWIKVCTLEELKNTERQRKQLLVNSRNVFIFLVQDEKNGPQVHCLDTLCYRNLLYFCCFSFFVIN